MVYKNFEELVNSLKGMPACRAAVAAAQDEHTLEAVFKCAEEGIIEPVLVGDKNAIVEILDKLGKSMPGENIYEASTLEDAAFKAVELVRKGKADVIMKGKLDTSVILREVVKRETGLRNGHAMSHIAINEIPSYHKLVITTDGGMTLQPSLEQKKEILINAVTAMRALGVEQPKVGVLAAAEKINEKLTDSVDAAALKEMNQKGEITDCIVEGPISLDLAMVAEKARAKGYESPCAGDVDILIVPNITAGNILGKSMTELDHGKMAGLIIGAKCPIVVTSRGSSSEEKYNALMLAAKMAGGSNGQGKNSSN
ncbi:bifunctional enoyl-CoA hydratase/phosphate acetyltransferase [bacterium 210820-DFI.6.37]|nr:bifunctional enoyl-CoA hydratase/phosphate acetyltransferase [bacterium 210820-DFI.6.37]